MSFRRSIAAQLLAIGQSVFPDVQVHPAGVTPSASVTRYIAYQRISAVHARHLGGGTGLANPRYQITAWARKASDANAIAERIRIHLDNLRGDVGEAGDLERVNGSFLQDDQDTFESPTDASQEGWHGVTMDFTFWHEETETPSP